jgi:DNA-directed RNA polymerase subunit RPC12/RpoP
MHGIGNSESQGDSTVLFDAQNTKEEMLKRSKYVTKPRYPREWLGKTENNIRQLVSGLRFFGQMEGRDIKLGIDFETLEVQKGTICAPNDKPAGGYIDLDLGPQNQVSIKVFFVPVRSEGNLKGSSYKNHRVEFLLGFSLSHGYEAFNVKLLGQQKCPQCKKNVEKRSCDTEIMCPRCEIVFQAKKQPKQSRNESNKS